MVFPGLKGAPEHAIVSFLAETRAALEAVRHVYLGASVFGVAATRPTRSPRTSRRWPSTSTTSRRWSTRRTGRRASTASPTRTAQPYEIVRRSLEDFQKDVRGTGARVVPWLQDFSLGVHYGPAQVAAQIQAAKDDGIDEYLLWDPAGHVHRRARSPPDARTAVLLEAEDPGGGREEPEAERARPRAGADAPPDPAARERLRPDRRAAPGRADAALAGRLLPRTRRRPRHGQDRRAEGATRRSCSRSTTRRTTRSRSARTGASTRGSALGVLEAFAKTHHDFPARRTFYVPRNAFDGNGRTPASTLSLARRARLRARQPHQGPHPAEHARPHRGAAPARARQPRAHATCSRATSRRRWRCRSAALPQPTSLATKGTLGRPGSYSFAGVFLAGAEPAPSPFSTKWDPAQIPRIRTNPNWNGSRDFTAGMWLDLLERNPGLRYVSDGDTETITFPRGRESELAPAFRGRAKPY